MKSWPALDASGGDTDFLLAEIDAYSPTAVEDRGEHAVRVFFPTSELRNGAIEHLAARGTPASPVDVPDEDWARRSQENLRPIVVGRITVTPPWHAPALSAPQTVPAPRAPSAVPASPAWPAPSAMVVVIQPSMGFGTGHHATTRLCLAALQSIDLAGADVLDVGTGSGVLAIAACLLSARRARGIDNDPDAIQCALENRALNPAASGVDFDVIELSDGVEAEVADVVIANLTGALLERSARILLAATRPGGTIIVSGLLTGERAAVEGAFRDARRAEAWVEDEWAALMFVRG